MSGYAHFDYYEDTRGCTCESYCRCGTIQLNGRSNDSEYSPDDLYNKLLYGTEPGDAECSEAMYQYGLHRLSRILHVDELQEPRIEGGYYGEELGDCFPFNANEIQESVNTFLKCETDFDGLMYLLKLEYGYISPVIEECSNVERITVQCDDVKPVPGMIKDNPYIENGYPNDIPLMVTRSGGTVRVDGRHRLHMAHVQNIEEFDVWNLCK